MICNNISTQNFNQCNFERTQNIIWQISAINVSNMEWLIESIISRGVRIVGVANPSGKILEKRFAMDKFQRNFKRFGVQEYFQYKILTDSILSKHKRLSGKFLVSISQICSGSSSQSIPGVVESFE